jgi:hypothetical protein
MTLDNKPIYTGGCQCGAVRFRIDGALGSASICHCRMCQKAFGNFYAPLVSVDEAKLEWTRGEPKRFRSSNHVQRGFCPECGTPLTYEAPDGVALAIGAFDAPEEASLCERTCRSSRLCNRTRSGEHRIRQNTDFLPASRLRHR